jgi:hypothetical protein
VSVKVLKVVYEMIPASTTRKQLHLKAAKTIKKTYVDDLGSFFPLLVHHTHLGGDMEGEIKAAQMASRWAGAIEAKQHASERSSTRAEQHASERSSMRAKQAQTKKARTLNPTCLPDPCASELWGLRAKCFMGGGATVRNEGAGGVRAPSPPDKDLACPLLPQTDSRLPPAARDSAASARFCPLLPQKSGCSARERGCWRPARVSVAIAPLPRFSSSSLCSCLI